MTPTHPEGQEKNAEHTKGPWYVEDSVAVWTEDQIPIAHCGDACIDGLLLLPEVEANARLIAASPDLLEACKAAEEEMCAATFVKGVDKRGLNNAIGKCRTAIQKAKGAPSND